MASLKDDGGTLETQLYIIFNHEDDEAAHRCRQHLECVCVETIFSMLREVPYEPPAMDGSPKVIANSLETYFIEICGAIHNYSFDIFAHRLTKHKHKLSDIRGYIEQDRTRFDSKRVQLRTILGLEVGGVPSACRHDCHGRRQRADHETTSFHHHYTNTSKHLLVLTKHNLPKDMFSDNKVTSYIA
ncbi:hypothetical protein BGY98DRAFT_1097818 [Russula aff. rugulosa BPL654]|nr:hypothetical protein BGY98DRAFT_1097818 [Russula aff. rugulosa BPL654]